jgi:hypothetical protein
MKRLSSLYGAVLLAALAAPLAACGGQVEGAGAEPADDSGLQPAPTTSQSVRFPSGTIAIGGEAGGVTFYPPGATSSTAPLGHLNTATVAGFFPQYMTFDAQGYLYVDGFYDYGQGEAPANAPATRVDVYAPGSVGNAAPVRTILGPATLLSSTRAMAVDAQGNLFVANVEAAPNGAGPSVIAEFAPDATGDVAPTQVLQLNDVYFPNGLALDTSGDLYVTPSALGIASEFAPAAGATGPVSPLQTFTGPMTVNDPIGLARDASGTIYVCDAVENEVIVLASDGGGQVIAGSETQLGEPSDIAIDHDGRVLVATQTNGVVVFAPGATGNVAPVAALGVGPELYGYNVAVAP